MELLQHLAGPAKSIMDPIHGAIPVSVEELCVIDHPLMQRLRRLYQTDVLSLVFPGATHSRFEHSIGVMHLAGRCFDSLVRSGFRQRAARGERATPPAPDEIWALSYFQRALRLAALVHDSGHGPFSHQFETSPAVQRLYESAGLAEMLWSGLDRSSYVVGGDASFDHDEVAIRVALEILDTRATTDELETQDVLCILPRAALPPSPRFEQAAKVVLNRLFAADGGGYDPAEGVQILLRTIVAGTLNADAMDWLLRDSYFSGSKYGVFNLDHLIESLRFGFSLDSSGQPTWVGLAIADKGLGALEDFSYSRLQLYKQVFCHKAVNGFKLLLRLALDEILEAREVRRRFVAALTNTRDFADFHDVTVWSMIRDRAVDDRDSACRDLIERRKLTFLEKLEEPSPTQLREARRHHELGDTSRRVLEYEARIRSDPTERTLERIRVLARNRDGRRQLKDLSEFHQFSRLPADLRHVFLFGAKTGWARSRSDAGPDTKGFMICGMGIPCCGKSTVLRYLAGLLGAEYFREPEEAHWSSAVFERKKAGFVTALTWFRSVRVPHLFAAAASRESGGRAVVDSYYDKLVCHYLGKPGMEWLIPPDDPYFDSYLALARKDYELLPRPDLLIVFSVDEQDWRRFIRARGRELDRDELFQKSFQTQEYFVAAARALAAEQGVPVHEHRRRFLDTANPTETAARSLLEEIASFVE